MAQTQTKHGLEVSQRIIAAYHHMNYPPAKYYRWNPPEEEMTESIQRNKTFFELVERECWITVNHSVEEIKSSLTTNTYNPFVARLERTLSKTEAEYLSEIKPENEIEVISAKKVFAEQRIMAQAQLDRLRTPSKTTVAACRMVSPKRRQKSFNDLQKIVPDTQRALFKGFIHFFTQLDAIVKDQSGKIMHDPVFDHRGQLSARVDFQPARLRQTAPVCYVTCQLLQYLGYQVIKPEFSYRQPISKEKLQRIILLFKKPFGLDGLSRHIEPERAAIKKEMKRVDSIVNNRLKECFFIELSRFNHALVADKDLYQAGIEGNNLSLSNALYAMCQYYQVLPEFNNIMADQQNQALENSAQPLPSPSPSPTMSPATPSSARSISGLPLPPSAASLAPFLLSAAVPTTPSPEAGPLLPSPAAAAAAASASIPTLPSPAALRSPIAGMPLPLLVVAASPSLTPPSSSPAASAGSVDVIMHDRKDELELLDEFKYAGQSFRVPSIPMPHPFVAFDSDSTRHDVVVDLEQEYWSNGITRYWLATEIVERFAANTLHPQMMQAMQKISYVNMTAAIMHDRSLLTQIIHDIKNGMKISFNIIFAVAAMYRFHVVIFRDKNFNDPMIFKPKSAEHTCILVAKEDGYFDCLDITKYAMVFHDIRSREPNFRIPKECLINPYNAFLIYAALNPIEEFSAAASAGNPPEHTAGDGDGDLAMDDVAVNEGNNNVSSFSYGPFFSSEQPAAAAAAAQPLPSARHPKTPL